MGKLVVLKFADGSFEQGFAVTLQLGAEGELPSVEITGKLPKMPELPKIYREWQTSYLRLGNHFRLSADTAQVTNISITQDCGETGEKLRSRFNSWLLSDDFRPIREKWLERLSPTDEIRVILQTENRELQRLPWHLWDILERYPQAEIAMTSANYEKLIIEKTKNPQVKILAIIGNSQGINTQTDQILLKNLPAASVNFLVEPSRQLLNDYLWQENFDIFFFAGHSDSQGTQGKGRIFLNQTDSLSLEELRFALRKAVEKGLQLAIFNSCDGLGLVEQLADLHIPQIIVMREPVPDLVAQEFLKYFLSSFAEGESFYQAVRYGRERLQGLEDRFPCATWLPVIYQNLAESPPTWKEFTGKIAINPPTISRLQRLKTVVMTSLVVAAVVGGMRFGGVLQGGELQVFDQMMRSRSLFMDEGADPRLLIVTVDDDDITLQRRQGENLKGTSIGDKTLNQVIQTLEKYQPRAIGLDIYRDFPAEDKALAQTLRENHHVIGVCKGSDNTTKANGIAPPPEIPPQRQSYSDFLHDSDKVVRRQLLFMTQEAVSICPAPYALSSQLAFRYLLPQGIEASFTPNGDLQLGNTVFPRLTSRYGSYQRIDANGGQILINWRATPKIAEEIKLSQLLSTNLNPNAIKDRIILIGVTAKGDFPDYWATPYGYSLDEQMPGVIVQAQMLSQILSHVLDKRPLLQTWNPWQESVWILLWALIAGFSLGRSPSFSRLLFVICITTISVYILCLFLLIRSYWVPFLPSAMALIGTTTVIKIIRNS
ncbi:CHASE2 domain-containing protein [Calothrix sp. 336/3]|uniref:CHASE2 domain-containing protein n=1 Tax=Calothrix sp. 336/3 TaxID=1337936 RepID=UPI0004E3B3F8|nr:CHASE2 domain-containing protein [Calothrix sp. 336/3]AKG20280.1 sensor protein Chase2 [Calothrix sp. 336/3]